MASAKKKTSAEKAPTGAVERFCEVCLSFPDAYQAEWADGRRITGKRSFRIKKGEHREFALWSDEGEQPGGHLRYSDAARLADPRFERSRAHRGSKHNWMYLRTVPDAESALRALVAESYQAAQERGGGKAVSARQLYDPLRRGIAAAGAIDLPGDLHAGGPAAKVLAQEGPSAFRLALWSLETVRHLAPAPERAELKRGLAGLEHALQVWQEATASLPPEQVRMGRGYELLSRTAQQLVDPEGGSPPLVAARAAMAVFRCIPGGYSQRAVSHCGETVEQTVKVLAATGDPEAVRRYLVELDDRVLAEELVAVAAAKGKLERPPAIVRVLWRGADAKGFPGLWLARLEGVPAYGLLWKAGARWSWTTGSRDDVLASVPGEHFETAVRFTGLRDR